jgi:succinate dehydrogenase / fumarate reductase cytochrome b subunit
MVALSLHLKHGIESAIQTVGLKIPSYETFFKYGAMLIAFSIPAVFASIPIYIFLSSL